jgi:hypothetical protein
LEHREEGGGESETSGGGKAEYEETVRKKAIPPPPSASITKAEVRQKRLAEDKKEIERRKEESSNEIDTDVRKFSDKRDFMAWRMRWNGEYDDELFPERQSMEVGVWKACAMKNQFASYNPRYEFYFDKLAGQRM